MNQKRNKRKQAKKLKSCKIKNEWWVMKDIQTDGHLWLKSRFSTENISILIASDLNVSHGLYSEHSCKLLVILVLIKIFKLKSELAEKCSFRCWEREWGTICTWYTAWQSLLINCCFKLWPVGPGQEKIFWMFARNISIMSVTISLWLGLL